VSGGRGEQSCYPFVFSPHERSWGGNHTRLGRDSTLSMNPWGAVHFGQVAERGSAGTVMDWQSNHAQRGDITILNNGLMGTREGLAEEERSPTPGGH
jgi:hypothetical protein